MGSFTDSHGGGETISTAQLQKQKQVRVVESAETVDGFGEGDPKRVKFTLVATDKYDGNVLYSNNSIRVTMLKAVNDDKIPDEMDEWRGLKLGLFASKVQTPNGSTTARQVKILGWDEDVRKSKPAPTGGDDDFDESETDDNIPF
ncbi:hypothetical protein [Candidatus Poriferisodalis sp.]|uniref:hypothetical protein n=1 Tax=Candidatus Poriferisodalis sp. TaxID=3101277 RepID=UPI003B0146EE